MKIKNSKNKNLIKAVNDFKPFDYGYLLTIEKEALISMSKYFSKSNLVENNHISARNCKIAAKLIDIANGDDRAYQTNEGKDYLTKYINIRNCKRFLPHLNPNDFADSNHLKSILREEKAWYLYNKLRFYSMKYWWD